ncbi:MAG: sulfotransferase family protein [Roseovarius sp.]|nr:sulfotransferase family protein [Roseovarius sp.]
MISHQYKAIFIHIPKCAGTSIEAALGHHADFAGYGRQDHRTIRRLKPHPNPVVAAARRQVCHLRYASRLIAARAGFPYRNPRSMLTVTRAQFDAYFKFAFVRNPWDRLYSIYRKLMAGDWKTGEYGIDAPMEFDEFLERFAADPQLKPQTEFICDEDGAVLVDFIGRFENLNRDFATVCDRLGLDRIALPHEIRGPGGDYRTAYSAAGRDLVARLFAEEIALLGYDFE